MPYAALLTVADAARRSGLSEAAVRQRAARGTLPSVRQGGRLLIPADALPAMGDASPDTPHTPPDTPADVSGDALGLIPLLRAENARLWEELVARRGEVRELHTLLAQSQARPALAAETVSTPTRPAHAARSESAPRRWWQRWRA